MQPKICVCNSKRETWFLGSSADSLHFKTALEQFDFKNKQLKLMVSSSQTVSPTKAWHENTENNVHL